jgi:hypothetical protein
MPTLPWLLARYCPTETSVSGEQKDIARDAKRFTSRLKSTYARRSPSDAKGFKKCVVSLVSGKQPSRDQTITTEWSPTEEEPRPSLNDFRRRRTLIPDGANIDFDFAFLGQVACNCRKNGLAVSNSQIQFVLSNDHRHFMAAHPLITLDNGRMPDNTSAIPPSTSKALSYGVTGARAYISDGMLRTRINRLNGFCLTSLILPANS